MQAWFFSRRSDPVNCLLLICRQLTEWDFVRELMPAVVPRFVIWRMWEKWKTATHLGNHCSFFCSLNFRWCRRTISLWCLFRGVFLAVTGYRNVSIIARRYHRQSRRDVLFCGCKIKVSQTRRRTFTMHSPPTTRCKYSLIETITAAFGAWRRPALYGHQNPDKVHTDRDGQETR